MLQLFKRGGFFGFLFSILVLSACSTTPEVQEFSASADPSQEINKLENNLNASYSEQVNVFSPDNYKKARKHLDNAKEARSDNKSNKKVLKQVALGNAWLTKANEVARKGSYEVPDIADVRMRALEKRADVYAKDKWKDAEEDLIDLGEDFEDGDFSVKSKERQSLLSQYMDAELSAIKNKNLGPAQANIRQAEKEGAKKIAPQTLALAKKRFTNAENYIVSNRQNHTGIDQISEEARREAERVLYITRDAKANKNKSPEQIALALEAEENAQRKLSETLSQAEQELGESESNLAAVSAETSELSDKVELDERYKTARAQFGPHEAEVFKDVDKIIIRLKGLKFPSGQADLTSDSYSLMTKVQTAIKAIGSDADIEVEGHTDAIGSKELNAQLSEERADTVKNYLVENGAVESSHVTASGYADEKPIATNRTPQGRAENRRVDIIITPQ